LTYQWFFNQEPLPNQTAGTLDLVNVSPAAVGYYSVRVTNDLGQGVESLEAALEIGDRATAVSFNKLAEALAAVEDVFGTEGAGGQPQPFAAAGASIGFASVSVGGIGGQTFDNTTAAGSSCVDCDVVGGAAQWFVLTAEGEGTLTLDTVGSTFDTVLYVYSNAPLSQICSRFIACNDNGAVDVTSSLLSFQAYSGVHYLIGVDGVNAAKGGIHLNWKLCMPPAPFQYAGNEFVLVTGSNPAPYPDDPDYHWRKDGELLGATAAPTFALSNSPVQTANFSVDYSSVVNGSVKLVTKALGVFVPASSSAVLLSSQFQILLPGTLSPNFRLESAMPGLTNCDGGWLWLPFTNYVVATQMTSLVLTLPIEATNRLHRIRPSTP